MLTPAGPPGPTGAGAHASYQNHRIRGPAGAVLSSSLGDWGGWVGAREGKGGRRVGGDAWVSPPALCPQDPFWLVGQRGHPASWHSWGGVGHLQAWMGEVSPPLPLLGGWPAGGVPQVTGVGRGGPGPQHQHSTVKQIRDQAHRAQRGPIGGGACLEHFIWLPEIVDCLAVTFSQGWVVLSLGLPKPAAGGWDGISAQRQAKVL